MTTTRPMVSGALILALAIVAMLIMPSASAASEAHPVDLLDLAAGAIPVALGADADALKVSMDLALAAIDGNPRGFVLTPKPGTAEAEVTVTYKLPALTTFTAFAVPSVLETPSPSQTFFRDVTVAGSDQGPDGPFETLGQVTLTTHPASGQVTRFDAVAARPVRWVKLTLRGGLDVQREQTFFEFSEIVGWGSQDAVPLLDAFTGIWKGRGVLIELRQDGARVRGCYDWQGDLEGSVSGNLLRATGTQRTSGVPSTFVLTVTDDGSIMGVRSSNGAPFRLYAGEPAPNLAAECTDVPPSPPGCGSIVHGIGFGFDSAAITPDSEPMLDALTNGLKDDPAAEIVVVGHTSSEGAEDYNRDLSRRRAEAVVEALVERGIDASRLTARGSGEDRPIADNATEVGRSLNRRVEVECR